MRGASAIEALLRQEHSPAIRVFVVWEPILPTDWMRPSGMVQSRISDPRVVQFWDKGHLVAKELDSQLSSHGSGPRSRGILWDFAALYDRQAQWDKSPPVLAEGPVVKAAPDVQTRLAALLNASQ